MVIKFHNFNIYYKFCYIFDMSSALACRMESIKVSWENGKQYCMDNSVVDADPIALYAGGLQCKLKLYRGRFCCGTYGLVLDGIYTILKIQTKSSQL